MMTIHARIGVRGPLRVAALITFALSMQGVTAATTTFITGTGGTRSTFKNALNGHDLVCDLTGVPIQATDSPVSLVLGGLDPAGAAVLCDEVDPSNGNLIIRSGMFTFSQIGELENCLSVQTSGGQTTWTCAITGPTTHARWKFTPLDTAFCADPNNLPNNFNPCFAEHGTPLAPTAADFPVRDVDGVPGNDLALGDVLTFSAPSGRLLFGPCHSGSFDGSAPVVCDLGTPEEPKPTRTAAGPNGVPDADGLLISDLAPTPLNLSNKSTTAALPGVIYGAEGQLNVATINSSSITFKLEGFGGTSQPLRIKSAAAKYLPGPNGEPADALQDLQVKFQRADLVNGIRVLTGVSCPKLPVTLSIQMRGYFGNDPANGWTSIATIDAFNCPAK